MMEEPVAAEPGPAADRGRAPPAADALPRFIHNVGQFFGVGASAPPAWLSSSDVLLLEALHAVDRRLVDRAQRVAFAAELLRRRAIAQWQAVRGAHTNQQRLGRDDTTLAPLRRLSVSARKLALALKVEPPAAGVDTVFERAVALLKAFAKAIETEKLALDLREDIDRALEVAHRHFVVCGPGSQNEDAAGVELQNLRMHADAMVGLALSGGGIRSASFSLGAIQALAQRGLLSSFDFVSSVSGGGYAASLLCAWAYRHRRGIAGVQEDLNEAATADHGPLRWVRRHCAYLAPRLQSSIFSDVWSLGVAYVSNWLPILLLLSSTLAAVLLLPHLLVAGVDLLRWPGTGSSPVRERVLLLGAFLLLMFAGLVRRLTIFYREPGDRTRFPHGLPELVFYGSLVVNLTLSVSVPLMWAALDDLSSHWPPIAAAFAEPRLRVWALLATALAAVAACSYVIAYCATRPLVLRLFDGLRRLGGKNLPPGGPLVYTKAPLAGAVVAAAVSCALVAGVLTLLAWASYKPEWPPAALLVSVGPLFAVAMFAAAELFGTTLIPYLQRDRDRAWSARVGGWMLASAAAWALLCAVSLYLDHAVRQLFEPAAWPFAAAATALLALAIWRWFGFAGIGYAAVAAAFVVGLLHVLLSPVAVDPFATQGNGKKAFDVLVAFIAAAGAAVVVAILTNVNRFSLHALYKEGLVRTFLGASRLATRNPGIQAPQPAPAADEAAQFAARRPDAVTNVDERDDPALHWLQSRRRRDVPLLLLNAAVNGTSPTDIEGRVPRQWPFTFSPLFCGSPVTGIGYARTADFGQRISLGTAMAVSGAAMSPTSGRSTHPFKAFILGILNARLGLWVANPSVPRALASRGPRLAGRTVLSEMLGVRRQFGPWIHLSDGGHFENLGVYELVRRGCRRIVAIDASCDAERGFADLANTIRRVRIDLGIRIYRERAWEILAPDGRSPAGSPPAPRWSDAGPDALAAGPPQPPKPRSWTWFEIDYGTGQPRGRLLYVKPSVYADQTLPIEVLQYWKSSPNFPHETTADQFFSETQFEAYRALGQACMVDALAVVLTPPSRRAASVYDEDPRLVDAMMRAQKGELAAERA